LTELASRRCGGLYDTHIVALFYIWGVAVTLHTLLAYSSRLWIWRFLSLTLAPSQRQLWAAAISLPLDMVESIDMFDVVDMFDAFDMFNRYARYV
jgi:hypothetical protein